MCTPVKQANIYAGQCMIILFGFTLLGDLNYEALSGPLYQYDYEGYLMVKLTLSSKLYSSCSKVCNHLNTSATG